MVTNVQESQYAVAHRFSGLSGVNTINSALMVLSCVIAYLVPLELFLFSYAVLGPLHYLTQISWLQKRDFYVKGRFDHFFLIALCVLIAAVSALKLSVSISLFIGIAFGGALAILFLQKNLHKVIAIGVITAAAIVISRLPVYGIVFGLFVPTIIHVYVFTGLFILYGSLKSKSRSGYISLAVFLVCSVSFFIVNPHLLGITDNLYFRRSYGPFARLNYFLARLLGFSDIARPNEIFHSSSGVALMRFVAFAYTYHYLNWFSKTSVINWHKISRARWAAVIALWIASVAVYAVDYRIGFIVLLALSMSHVLLEFPLDYRTFWGICTEIGKRIPRNRLGSASPLSE